MGSYLIDSNAVIDYLGGKLPASGMAFINTLINEIPNISVITKIEVLGHNAPPDSYQLLTDFVDSAIVIDLTDDIINQTISIRKAHKIKTPDAIIAATALVFEMELVSRNISDFKNIQGLKTVNPWELK